MINNPHLSWGDAMPYGTNTNRFARWARTCGLCALVPFAVVFGLIGLVQTRRTGQAGRNLAVVGLVAAAVWSLLIYNLVDIFSGHVRREAGGGVAVAQPVDVTQLQAGDCFRIVTKNLNGTISTVVLMPCSRANDGEVYATPALPVQNGVTSEQAAQSACERARPASVPQADVTGFLYPTEASYANGHGHASCFSNG